MTAEEMGLSKEILQLCHLPKGLVLVTGPTGSGKSTTLSALIDYINRNRTDHIITIEDPLEFVHENKKCLINQRQVGEHTDSFKDALRAALREDPDIVLVGEMRDLETVAIAIETAETGHLVFGTLHTSSAPSTVDRIIDQFPADRQEQIRVMLVGEPEGRDQPDALQEDRRRARARARGAHRHAAGRQPDPRGQDLPDPVDHADRARSYGMCLMNESFLDLVKRKVVEPQEAYAKAIDKPGLLNMFKKNNIDTSWAPAGARRAAPPRRRPPERAAVVLAVDGAQPDRGRAWRGARRGAGRRASSSSIPTDTLYALGGRALDPAAARRVRAAKGREDGKPLPLVAADLEQARALCAAWPRGRGRLAAALLAGAAHPRPARGARRSRRGHGGHGRRSPSACPAWPLTRAPVPRRGAAHLDLRQPRGRAAAR